jgi:general L-amino acid transport system substrate-binding protein
MFLDLCHAVGAAVLGPGGKIAFTAHEGDLSYEAARSGDEDVSFVSGSEIIGEKLAGAVLPGPVIFYETTGVMVPQASPVRSLADLAGRPICFEQGSNAHRHLEAWFEAHRLSFQRMGYQEVEEMRDAYNAQACVALAGETTTLAEAALDRGVKGIESRIIGEPLAAFPILAASPIKDGEWATIIAWTVATLIRAEAPHLDWAAGGLDAIPVDAPEIGLDKGWQKRVIEATGSYADIFRRNLGAASRYRLPRGLNAPLSEGGMLVVPYLE